MWLTKDEIMAPQVMSPHSERGYYIVWDAASWRKERVCLARLPAARPDPFPAVLQAVSASRRGAVGRILTGDGRAARDYTGLQRSGHAHGHVSAPDAGGVGPGRHAPPGPPLGLVDDVCQNSCGGLGIPSAWIFSLKLRASSHAWQRSRPFAVAGAPSRAMNSWAGVGPCVLCTRRQPREGK